MTLCGRNLEGPATRNDAGSRERADRSRRRLLYRAIQECDEGGIVAPLYLASRDRARVTRLDAGPGPMGRDTEAMAISCLAPRAGLSLSSRSLFLKQEMVHRRHKRRLPE